MLVYLEIAAFLLFVNFIPPLSKEILGARLNLPLDFGVRFFDQRPLFGSHKTIRGFIAGLLCGSLFTLIWPFGLKQTIISCALLLFGDLLTSFLKRRAGCPDGKVVPVVDQFLEGALPLLFLWRQPGVDGLALIPVFLFFVPVNYWGSTVWFYLIYKTAPANSPRIIRSTTRLKEWRACHQALARWQILLNFEHFFLYRVVIGIFFRIAGAYRAGQRNALVVRVEEYNFMMDRLPPAFDGFRILFLTDLHIDGSFELLPVVLDKLKTVKADICILGGDYRMATYGSIMPTLRSLKKIVQQVRTTDGVFGILGNHDCIEMLPDLEEAGVFMLVNDAWGIERDGQRLWLAGIDDPHFYKTHDLDMTFSKITEEEFCIFLSHSPEVYKEAAEYKPDLYLCGHTHGGQICLPGPIILFSHCRVPRSMCMGSWRYQGMQGFTSRGVGASGVPLRFNSTGEIAVLTLKSRLRAQDQRQC